ncbi:hypothetical protein HPP92_010166 [Vanilla planifolia]|uniref:Uncharacterized protein n=1 Tax=Vanilla planifolia TaxID=51239 RepID=A0A835QWN4_VANPL|nr:hypothetical protein HPP92_010166 [Vanilla planifolia]
MSSNLLAYGSSDGSLTVCRVSEPPSVIQQLKGPSKGITASRGTSSCVKDRSNIKEPNMRKNLQNYDKDGDLQNVVSFYITGQLHA